MPDSEAERLKRLRERQLTDRDPLVKQRQFQRSNVVKEKRMRKRFSLKEAWNDIPHMIKSPFYGLLVGVLVIAILPKIWNSPYATLAGTGATVLFIIFGLILGNSLDLRDNLRDQIK
jgi:hypothetical protein